MGAWSGESGDLGSDTEVCKLKSEYKNEKIGISQRCANFLRFFQITLYFTYAYSSKSTR